MGNRIRAAATTRDEGFSLIEVVIALAIIAIIAAIAAPIYISQKRKAVDSSLRSDINNMALAQETAITSNPVLEGVPWAEGDPLPPELSDVRISDGNTITVEVNNGGYCIRGWNPKASPEYRGDTPINVMTYDSLAGGLGRTGGACQ